MRRFRMLLAIFATLILIGSLVPTAFAADLRVEDLPVVTVIIDGQKLDADAYIVGGRTVVPLRAIFDRLSIKLDWNGATRTITGTKGSKTIKLVIDQTEAYVGDQVVQLSVPPMIINGRTFVPVRFIAESTGIDPKNVTYDSATRTVTIITGSGCTLAPNQVHEGKISPQGETWGLCGSPHVVRGDYLVEGPDSPVLTIEAGALIQFEEGASLHIGRNAPGGLLINGQADNKVTLASASASAMPGSWNGIRFYPQTMKGYASIIGASIQNAGGNGNFNGAIYLEGEGKLVEVLVKDTDIKNSQFAGINMYGQAQLAAGSGNLAITGTKAANGEGGFPIVTGLQGSNNLPAGTYTDNDFNAVHLWTNSSYDTISKNTTWKNLGIPYASSMTVSVEGNASPTLKIEPGVITLWNQDAGLKIGENGPGTLIADAKTKPDGSGDWNIDKTTLDAGLGLATSEVMTGPICSLCGKNPAIVFGAWSDQKTRGGWEGIRFYAKAGDKSKLNGIVVAYGGKDGNFNGGIYVESDTSPVKLLLANSLITGAANIGVQLYGNNSSFLTGSTGNYYTNNVMPLRMFPESIGSLEAGQNISGNDNDWISIWSNGGIENVTKTATWRNHGVPYYFEVSAQIGSSTKPTITIDPGTKLTFAQDTGLQIGADLGVGSLVAVGSAGKPITFTSEVDRAGTWRGLEYTTKAGNGNKLENVTIEYATNAVSLESDLGAFIKNSTIRSCSENGIYRGYDLSKATNFMTGLGNQFEGNAVDMNQ